MRDLTVQQEAKLSLG